MDFWESGKTKREGPNTWVIVSDAGAFMVKFNKARYPELADIVGGEAVKFTRNPNNSDWASKIVLDSGLKTLTTTAEDGASLTSAARARLGNALAERLFWASFLPETEQADAAQQLQKRLQALTGSIKTQTLIDEGL
jgi:hypothetical protein